MTVTGARGVRIPLTAEYRDSLGNLADPTSPTVVILDPLGVEFVPAVVPTHTGTGLYAYPSAGWLPPLDAALGDYTARWYGFVNGEQVGPVDETVTVTGSTTDACPQPWITEGDLPCTLETAMVGMAIAGATELLYVLSGSVYGLCPVVLRPNVCAEGCGCSAWWEYRQAGQWGSWASGSWAWAMNGACSCCATDLRLPSPIHEITSVTVDGVTLDPGAYALYDRHRLVRMDGGSWPCCQLLSSNPATLIVHAMAGSPVPAMGRLAAMELACQIGAIGTPACKLPARIQTITRQGMSWTVVDPQDFLDNGRLGLYLCDAFLAAVNPAKVRAPVRVMSPDSPRTSVPT